MTSSSHQTTTENGLLLPQINPDYQQFLSLNLLLKPISAKRYEERDAQKLEAMEFLSYLQSFDLDKPISRTWIPAALRQSERLKRVFTYLVPPDSVLEEAEMTKSAWSEAQSKIADELVDMIFPPKEFRKFRGSSASTGRGFP